MVGKTHSAQALTIELLQMLSPEDRYAVFVKAQSSLSDDAAEQLSLCISMAGELKQDPDKYNDFSNLGKTILARQKKEKRTKKELGKTIGLKESSINQTLSQIDEHIRKLKPEEILRLCQDFDKQVTRQFWENQIYLLFPYLAKEDVTDGPVLDTLHALWDSLSYQEQETALSSLPAIYKDWFRQLQHKPDEPEIVTGTGLYDIIDNFRKSGSRKIFLNKILNELDITQDTFNSYRAAWKAYERDRCRGSIPKNHLSRTGLMRLAVFLDMDFYTAVAFLAAGGYCFHQTRLDITVAEYLLQKNHTKQYVLDCLYGR